MKARNPADLLRPFSVPPAGQDAAFGLPKIASTIGTTRQSWTDAFQTMGTRLAREGGKAVEKVNTTATIEEMARRFALQLDADGSGQ